MLLFRFLLHFGNLFIFPCGQTAVYRGVDHFSTFLCNSILLASKTNVHFKTSSSFLHLDVISLLPPSSFPLVILARLYVANYLPCAKYKLVRFRTLSPYLSFCRSLPKEVFPAAFYIGAFKRWTLCWIRLMLISWKACPILTYSSPCLSFGSEITITRVIPL